ncbi:TPA: glycosyltransferase family 2 protein, partial [Mannheimia haemolytica]
MLSILIITYGRYQELLDTLKSINRFSGERIELLLLDNNSSDKLKLECESVFSSNRKIEFTYFNDGINYGVAKGRNYLIERAKGDILITLDDDIECEDITQLVNNVRNYFSNNKNIGALAFNIKNFYTREALRHEIPHGRKDLDFTRNFNTYYFIGAGHAIRKEAYERAGLYPLYLGLYGGEERDLSFRILEAGFDILYASDLVIYHKVSPNGRMTRKEEDYYRYRNQLIVLNRYMPQPYRLTSNIIWSIYYLFYKKGNVIEVMNTYKDVIRIEKFCISKETLGKLKKLK